jgi:uncharacterized membrane protein
VTTIVIVLVMLIAPTVAGAAMTRQRRHSDAIRHGAAVGLSISFAFFAYGHFAMTDELVEMLPPWVPARSTVILATGVLEVAIAVGLLLPRTRWVSGIVAAAVFVLFFPANIYAALHSVGPGGHQAGPEYLLLRAPLQLLLLIWTYWFVLRRPLRT